MEPEVHPFPDSAPFPSTPNLSQSSESSLSAILRNLPEIVVSHVEELSGFATEIIINHVLPAILFAAAFIGLWNLGRVVSRVIWPPSGRETYLEAVALLKKDAFVEDNDASRQEGESGERTALSANRSEALELLRTAITKDPELEEAYVTLATELLYGPGGYGGGSSGKQSSIDIESALVVLEGAKKRFPKNKEVELLLTEAKAMSKFGVGGTEGANAKMRRMAGMGMFANNNLSGGARVR